MSECRWPKCGCAPIDRCAELPATWPIARLTVKDGRVESAKMYVPGLPDGEHDVWATPVPSANERR